MSYVLKWEEKYLVRIGPTSDSRMWVSSKYFAHRADTARYWRNWVSENAKGFYAGDIVRMKVIRLRRKRRVKK